MGGCGGSFTSDGEVRMMSTLQAASKTGYNHIMSFRPPAGEHFGAIADCDVAGFTLTHTAYAPNQHLPPHAHERACFCLNLRGSYVERFGRMELDCQSASLLVRPPGESHSNHFHNVESQAFLIEPETAWLDNVREQGVRFAEPSTVRGAATWLAVKVFEEFQHRDTVSPLAVQGLMLTLAAELARVPIKAKTKLPRWLQQVKDLLHAHFAEPLSLEFIASSVGVHPVYLAAAFRKHQRCTIGDYVRQLRVEYACRAMLKPEVSLIEIAFAAGFSSQSHFSRTFKQLTGMSPAQYRAIKQSS
jgi:AraC family transcriptional regulator